MTRLVLWRHGRTAWNYEQRWQGQTDVDLDEAGLAQAIESAPRVAAYKPDILISSDLIRAAHTAEQLARLADLPISLDARLRERHFGPWQGQTTPEIRLRNPEYDQLPGSPTLLDHPDVEPLDDLVRRVSLAVRDALERVADGTAVLVLHGGTARVACGILLGWPRELWPTLAVLRNCGICELRHSDQRGWQLASYNC